MQHHGAHGGAAAALALHELNKLKTAQHTSTCSFCCFKHLAPEMSSPELGCSTTVHTGARLPYSRCTPGARRSHTLTVWSSDPENSHLLSLWKPSCGKRRSEDPCPLVRRDGRRQGA